MRLLMVFIVAISFISCGKFTETPQHVKPADEISSDAQYKKEMEEIKKSLKGEIKVKLKKDGKGGYNWEITGKDVQEVLRANEALRRRLSDERPS